jgi:hypothetical protein
MAGEGYGPRQLHVIEPSDERPVHGLGADQRLVGAPGGRCGASSGPTSPPRWRGPPVTSRSAPLGGSLFAEPWQGVVAVIALALATAAMPAVWRCARGLGPRTAPSAQDRATR